jgi:hypothetical protein
MPRKSASKEVGGHQNQVTSKTKEVELDGMELEKEENGVNSAGQKVGVIRTTEDLVKALHSSSVDVRIKTEILHRIWHRSPSSSSFIPDIAGVLLPNRNRTILEWTISLVIRIFTSPTSSSSLTSLAVEGHLESLWLFLNEVLRSPLISPSTTISNPHHLQNAIQSATLLAWKEINLRLKSLTSSFTSSSNAMEVGEDSSSQIEPFLRLAEAVQTTFETLHRKFSSSSSSSSSSSLAFLSSSFRTSVDQSVAFLSALNTSIVGELSHLLSSSSSSPTRKEAIRFRYSVLKTLSLALHRCNVSLQQQANPKKVFGLIVTKLLEHFILLRSQLLELKEEGSREGEEESLLLDHSLLEKIISTIQDLLSRNLFHSATISDYSMAFTNYKPTNSSASSEKREESSKVGDRVQPRGQKRTRHPDEPDGHQDKDGGESGALHSYQQSLFAALRKLVQENQEGTGTKGDSSLPPFPPSPFLTF